jgi:hypothetical protein
MSTIVEGLNPDDEIVYIALNEEGEILAEAKFD